MNIIFIHKQLEEPCLSPSQGSLWFFLLNRGLEEYTFPDLHSWKHLYSLLSLLVAPIYQEVFQSAWWNMQGQTKGWVSLQEYSLCTVRSNPVGLGFRVAQVWGQALPTQSPHLLSLNHLRGLWAIRQWNFPDSFTIPFLSSPEAYGGFSQVHSCKEVVSGQWERLSHPLEWD